MPAEWAMKELRGADLKDARIHARLCEVLTQLGQRPAASIPAACGGHAETTAAYRLFDNDQVRFADIVAPHAEATRQRLAGQPTVLLVQDTTEIEVTRPAQQVQGVGPLDAGARRGLLLHLLHAFTPDGTPLGTLAAKPWTREEQVPAAHPRPRRTQIPIEQKERYRWLETLRVAQAEAAAQPSTRMVCVADSEADLYELLVAAQAAPRPSAWVVRACYDRALQEEGEGESTSAGHLREELLRQPLLFTRSITVRGRDQKITCEQRGRRQARLGRTAQVAVRATHVTLRPPARPDRHLLPLQVNVVFVQEMEPPAGEEPVEWLLLTSLPVDQEAQIDEVLQFYRIRWMIEIFFRVLKVGCRVEDRRFESYERLLRCLAVYLIVAWRTLCVCRWARACPEISCEVLFAPEEWKSVWQVIHRRPPPVQPPTLGVLTLLVARLGGYLPRKNSPPGPQTIWVGLQRMHDFALAWQAFGPESGIARSDV
jgi:hypothetical protein